MEVTFIKSGTLVEKKFREFFFPTVLASMAAQLGTIVNGIIVGNFINPSAMAAISACLPLNQITYAAAVLISIGSAALIAIASGARDKAKADYIFSTVIAVSIFFLPLFFWSFLFRMLTKYQKFYRLLKTYEF